MIYVTGDTHGNFQRFKPEYFPEQNTLTRNDCVIICGDFGGIWTGGHDDDTNLDQLAKLPFTILFVDGNHENFDLLNALPVEEWAGGKIHRLRPNVLHLMRGQVFEIQGYTFFTMGGASSHDIYNGILDPEAPDFEKRYWDMRRTNQQFRVNHINWWADELPSAEEYDGARTNLERIGWQVDYVITHCAPSSVASLLGGGSYLPDNLTDFLEEVNQRLKYHYWLFGHYHDNRNIGKKHVLLWEQIVQII